jgi:REP element-mobilizing transposase RayT
MQFWKEQWDRGFFCALHSVARGPAAQGNYFLCHFTQHLALQRALRTSGTYWAKFATRLTALSVGVMGGHASGGFSFRVKKELAFKFLVWEESFTNHRIRDAEDYQRHRDYIHNNPVEAGLVKTLSEYLYSSAHPGMELDPAPPGLKPMF